MSVRHGTAGIRCSRQDVPRSTALPAAETIAIRGAGHEVIVQSPCARSMMNAFFEDLTRPVDRSRLSEITIPPFKTP